VPSSIHLFALLISAAFGAFASNTIHAADTKVVRVKNVDELRAAVRAAKPDTRIEVAEGEYAGGLFLENLTGETGKPVVIAGANPAKPPHFSGGGNGIQLVNPAFVELHHLHFSGATGNGVSIDDGGKFSAAARDIVLRGLRISDIGPRGNHDAIKLSGITGFQVEDCVIERWGTGSGSGIDMVGCHNGLIARNVFRHSAAQGETGGNGVQAKGGSSGIIIRQNRFEHAGQRAVNIGGSTGVPYFRPPLDQWPKGAGFHEAKNIVVEGNTLFGSLAPLAFVGVDGATVRFNTIYRPGKWCLRILQETNAPGFVPCRGGVITDNIIAFQSGAWAEGGVNIGPNTAPESFRFARNHWFCLDRPDRSRPRLPAAEDGGSYGVDPQFENATALDLRIKVASPARGKGADGLRTQ
jgi:hypothetical protein